ncbi:AraC family transcriptional regulator [Pseudomonadota bacterium]
MNVLFRGLLAGLLVWPLLLSAEQTKESETGVKEEVQTLKQQVLELNRDLFLLEEELLFPSNTQVSVFVSMDVGEFFQLDSVEVKIDGKQVADYLYTKRELDALIRGGVQRIHIGNLPTGEHELVALFIGKGPKGRDYKRGATTTFKKGLGPKYVELKIVDQTKNYQPEFDIKEW